MHPPPDSSSPDRVREEFFFVPLQDWESLFVKALRHHAETGLFLPETSLYTKLTRYEFVSKDLSYFKANLLRLSIGVERESQEHLTFIQSLSSQLHEKLDFKIHFPGDLLYGSAEVEAIHRHRIDLSVVSPLYRRFNRKHARVSVRIPVVCHVFFSPEKASNIWIRAEGIDVSLGGLGFIARDSAAKHLPKVGEDIPGLYFKVGGRVCEVKAKIRHLKLLPEQKYPQRRFRVGVEFVDLSHDIHLHLTQLIEDELRKLEG